MKEQGQIIESHPFFFNLNMIIDALQQITTFQVVKLDYPIYFD